MHSEASVTGCEWKLEMGVLISSLVSEGTLVPIRSFRLDEYFCSGRLTRRVDAVASLPTW